MASRCVALSRDQAVEGASGRQHVELPRRVGAGDPDEAPSRDTVRAYLSALERLMIVEDQPAWAPHLRSKSRIRSASKRHFVDPSLAVAALRASPDRLLEELELLGFLFEAMVVRDLRVYPQPYDGTILQYRDNTGLEVDAVVETVDGRWAAFAIKLGTARIDQAAESLKKFAGRVDTGRLDDCLGRMSPATGVRFSLSGGGRRSTHPITAPEGQRGSRPLRPGGGKPPDPS